MGLWNFLFNQQGLLKEKFPKELLKTSSSGSELGQGAKPDKTGKGKQKKPKIPEGLDKAEIDVLKAVKRRAKRFDKSFGFCGIRFGWTFLISFFFPFVGDFFDVALNATLYYKVKELRLKYEPDEVAWLLKRMAVNNMFSLCVSFVPLVGDLIMGWFKANSRNAALLEGFLRIQGLRRDMQVPGNRSMPSGGAGWKSLVSSNLAGATAQKYIPRPPPAVSRPQGRGTPSRQGTGMSAGRLLV